MYVLPALFKDLWKQVGREEESKEGEREKGDHGRVKQDSQESWRRRLEKVKDREQDPGVLRSALGNITLAGFVLSHRWKKVQRHRKEASTRFGFISALSMGLEGWGLWAPCLSEWSAPPLIRAWSPSAPPRGMTESCGWRRQKASIFSSVLIVGFIKAFPFL